jgi:hypothetical protein
MQREVRSAAVINYTSAIQRAQTLTRVMMIRAILLASSCRDRDVRRCRLQTVTSAVWSLASLQRRHVSAQAQRSIVLGSNNILGADGHLAALLGGSLKYCL